MKFFKVYVCISLTVIMLLLAALVGSIIYAGKKASNESTTISSKVDTFNADVNNINANLKVINSQLKTENADLTQPVKLP